MLKKQELIVMRQNAKIHKKIFDEIKKTTKEWTTATQIDILAWDIARKNNVLCAFRWVYWYKYNIQTSVNDVVVHWRPLDEIVLKNWDLLTIDFWIKDKQVGIYTDAAFSMIVWWDDKNPEWARLIEANKEALYAWINQARAWNTVGDIWYAIEKEVAKYWYKIIKDLTGHAIWKKLHEKPYIYNFGTPWTWPKLKEWMTIAIEPILWQTSWEIVEEWDWEIFTKDGWLGCQYEHTVLITAWDPEIII